MVDILHISNFELEDGWKRRIFRPIRPVARLTRFHWLSTLSEKKTAKTPGKTTIHVTAVQRVPLDLQLLARLVLMGLFIIYGKMHQFVFNREVWIWCMQAPDHSPVEMI